MKRFSVSAHHLAAPLLLGLCTACIGQTPAASAAATGPAPAIALQPGDAAPPLRVGTWLKGDPVKSFVPDQVYVVEFWATWCGPCIRNIPHLTELQKQYGDKVIFIGQNVFENRPGQAKPFVEKMGDKMDYRVATDDLSDGSKGAMATTWMLAAGESSIPCAFIVNREGRVAWIGDPTKLAPILPKVLDGTFDTAAHKISRAGIASAETNLRTAVRQYDVETVLTSLDQIMHFDPAAAPQCSIMRIGILLQMKAYARAYSYGPQTLEALKDDPVRLNMLAWTIATDSGIEQRDLNLARQFADRAVEASPRKIAAIIDTDAQVHFMQGRVDEAVALETEAVAAANSQERPGMEKTLALYIAAPAKN